MTREEELLLKRLNKRMQRLTQRGIESTAMKETKNMLLNFYMKHDIQAPASGRFTTRKNLSDQEQKELLAIAKQFEGLKSSQVGFYTGRGKNVDEQFRKSYETAKANYPNMISDYGDYLSFIDRMENEDKSFKAYFDSKEMAQIYDYGYSLGMSSNDIQKIMKKQIRYGKRTDPEQRYDKTIARINKYYDKIME